LSHCPFTPHSPLFRFLCAGAVLSFPPTFILPLRGGRERVGVFIPLFRKEGRGEILKIPLYPPFPKGEVCSSPFFKGGNFSGEFAVARFLRSFVCPVASVVRQISHFLLPPPSLSSPVKREENTYSK